MAIFLLALNLSSFAHAEEKNLLKNPGFEEADKPFFWDENIWEGSDGKKTIKIDTQTFHSGKQSVYIKNDVSGDSRLTQTLDVKPSTIYKISGWIKTENVGTTNKGANFSILMLTETSKDVTGTSDWQQIDLYGRTGSDQNSITITMGLGGYGNTNTGVAYFDDISLTELTEIPAGANIINFFSPSTQNSTNSSGDSDKSWLIILAGFLLLAIAIVAFLVLKKPSNSTDETSNEKASTGPNLNKNSGAPQNQNAKGPPPFKIDKLDLKIMGATTLVYLIIALINLGNMSAPETFWKPFSSGESFIVNFEKDQNISRIGYYDNYGDGKYSVYYQNESGEFKPIGTMNQDVYNVFRWQHIADLNITTKKLKIVVDTGGARINEVVFWGRDSKEPIKNFKIEEELSNPKKDEGKIKNLFDEQDEAQYYNTFMNSTYFDEIYHPRTAYEHIHREEPYETTHPPLGKVIMMIGVLIFGMNPFGWRIMGTLFGAAMVPVSYLLGRKLFNKKIFAFMSAFLMMFEFMHFAQTRIGTIDSYPALFVMVAYFFMYDAFAKKSYKIGFKNSLKPLLLAGIAWGFGGASKWTAVYAGFGLAILFFTSYFTEILDYVKATSSKIKSKMPSWTRDFIKKKVILTPLLCIVFFVIIPGIIYVCSYLPIITLPGEGHNLDEVRRYQVNMYDYHKNLQATHPYQSTANMWPLNYKPLLEYRATHLPSDKVSLMYTMGNPIIFWFGLLALLATIIVGIWKKDKRAFFILVAYGCQYLPWYFQERGGCVFIYHYFTAIPFLILAVVYLLKFIYDDLPRIIGKAYMSKQSEMKARTVTKVIVYAYLAIVALFFVWLYPALSGMTVDVDYLKYVKWLNVL